MSEDYRCGFNTGYQEGYKTAKEENKRLKEKISELEDQLRRKKETIKTIEDEYCKSLDKIKALENLVYETTNITLTVGFTSMNAEVNQVVTGEFIDLEDDKGTYIAYEAKERTFADICFKELGKCKVTGHYLIKGTSKVFCIKSIKAV